MDSKDILSFAIERASALGGLWNLFIAVATGIIGVMASGKSFTTSRSLKALLSVAFVAFAYVNLDAMLRLGELRQALVNMLPSTLPGRPELVASLMPAAPWQYRTFHLFLDALVLAAIWIVGWPSSEKDVS